MPKAKAKAKAIPRGPLKTQIHVLFYFPSSSSVPTPDHLPFLEAMIGKFLAQGFSTLSVVFNDQGRNLFPAFRQSSPFFNKVQSHDGPVDIQKIMEKSPQDDFLLFPATRFYNADFNLFVQAARPPFSLALTYKEAAEKTTLPKVTLYQEGQEGAEPFLVEQWQYSWHPTAVEDFYLDTGVYFFSRPFLNKQGKNLPPLFLSPFLKEDKPPFRPYGLPLGGQFLDLTEEEDFLLAQSQKEQLLSPSTVPQPCLFLDRDGVLIHDKKYLREEREVELVEEILPILDYARSRNFLLVVLTNQSGIGRGFMDESHHSQITQTIEELLRKKNHHIDRWYYCPYHPTKGQGRYLKDSLLRKPHPGMALLAMADFSIDLNQSMMIGDKSSDALDLPGLHSLLIQGNYPLYPTRSPSLTFQDFSSLLEYLKTKKTKKIKKTKI